MRKIILISFVFLLIFASIGFASQSDGKLHVFPQSSSNKIYLDGLLVGEGEIQIESLAVGEYLLKAINVSGVAIYEQKVKIEPNKTTTINIEIKTPAAQRDVTSTVAIGAGYHALTLTGNNLFSRSGESVLPIINSSGSLPNVVSVDINTNVTDALEIQLGAALITGYISNEVNLNLLPVCLNLRYVWPSAGWFRSFYLGGGVNNTQWQVSTQNVSVSSDFGSQYFIGAYTHPWGYLGSLQLELGQIELAGKYLSNKVFARGMYFKAGWAF